MDDLIKCTIPVSRFYRDLEIGRSPNEYKINDNGLNINNLVENINQESDERINITLTENSNENRQNNFSNIQSIGIMGSISF